VIFVDVFTFIVSMLVMLVAYQHELYWLAMLIGGILVYMGKSTKTFIIILVVLALLYLTTGTAYQDYSIYIISLGVIAYLIFNREGGEAGGGASYNPNDQYADLLKGLGG
jgi:hypothetical protein